MDKLLIIAVFLVALASCVVSKNGKQCNNGYYSDGESYLCDKDKQGDCSDSSSKDVSSSDSRDKRSPRWSQPCNPQSCDDPATVVITDGSNVYSTKHRCTCPPGLQKKLDPTYCLRNSNKGWCKQAKKLSSCAQAQVYRCCSDSVPNPPEPVTQAPATEAPVTQAPATEAPVTQAPTIAITERYLHY